MKLVSILLLLGFVHSAFAWPRFNNPFKFDRRLISNFAQLPSEGKITQTYIAWPGSHWSNYLGGIAHRWSAGNPQNFSYKKLTAADLRQMSQS